MQSRCLGVAKIRLLPKKTGKPVLEHKRGVYIAPDKQHNIRDGKFTRTHG